MELGIKPREVRILGGGSRSPLWRKIIADLFGLKVYLLEVDEGSSYGAAILASVGSGAYKTVESAVKRIIRTKSPVEPDMRNHEKYRGFYEAYNRLYKALKQEFRRLAELV